MSTLSVSSIQNTASPTTNIVVNANGSVTLGLYRTPGVAPVPVQIGTLWYDIGGAGLVIWNGTSWAGVGGGGGGTVTGVTASAPLASSGGAAPDISLTGTIPVLNGGTGATTAAGAQANLLPSQAGNSGKVLSTDGAGVLSWIPTGGTGTVTSVTGTLPITVATGTTTPVIAINAATTGAQGAVQIGTNIDVTTGTISVKNASATDKGVIEIATLAEAATGTDATLALTPSTGVPKDAATMTGAALIPGGNNAARPTSTVTGMVRYNNQGGTPATTVMEYWNGSAWTQTWGSSGVGTVQAWVNFNGTPAAASIRASGNVSSVTKTSTGSYTLAFTTPLADANYSATISAQTAFVTMMTTYVGNISGAGSITPTPFTASGLDVSLCEPNLGIYLDSDIVCVTIVR